MVKILLVLLLCLSLYADNNQTKEISFYDEQDGMLDLSEYLSSAYGFLPIPTIITEPALGYGAGLGLVYLHDNFTGKRLDSGRVVPASMSGIVYMGTENGTRIGAGFHIGYYLEDNLRTISFVGIPDVNIDTYLNSNPISSNMQGMLAYQALKFRMFDTNLFLGGAFLYSNIDTTLDTNLPLNPTNSFNNSSLDFILEYDARDSTLSPTSGYFVNFKPRFFREEIGSDNDFELYTLNTYIYTPVTQTLNINFKVTGESISGEDAPFYSYPFVSLRGMPMMKVQGEHILASELELCWNFDTRWEALAFGGIGKAFGTNQFGKNSISFESSKNNYTKGVGFRYLVARKFGLKMGIDIASSEFDNAFYIQFGSAWAGF